MNLTVAMKMSRMLTSWREKKMRKYILVYILLLEVGSFCAGLRGAPSDEEPGRWLCDAQIQACCYDLGKGCEEPCGRANISQALENVKWVVNCSEENNTSEDSCHGFCSVPGNETGETTGYLPPRPNVTVTRDSWSKHIVLRWPSHPSSTSATVYVVTELRQNSTSYSWWLQAVQILGSEYWINSLTDICTLPVFQVAAVSRFGSRGFSKSVRTPDLIPGPPQEFDLVMLTYSPSVSDNDTIYFTLDWHPPAEWAALDIGYHDVQYEISCDPSNTLDVMYIFTDDIKLVQNETREVFRMRGRIPTYLFRCNITFLVRAASRCKDTLTGIPGNYTLELRCDLITNYTGRYCEEPEVVPPEQVKDIRLIIVPTTDAILGWVSWSPPDKLGTAGRVGLYHLFWGVIDLMNISPINVFKRVLGHTTVSGTILGTDLDLNVTSLSQEETVGVMVSAVSPGQVVDVPLGDICLPVNTATETGQVLTNDNIFLAVQVRENLNNYSVDVDVYWRRFTVENSPTPWHALQWGLLSKWNSTSENVTDKDLPWTNINVTEQEFLTLYDLGPNMTYGIQIVPLSLEVGDIYDKQNQVWSHSQLHTFTTLPVKAVTVDTSTPPPTTAAAKTNRNEPENVTTVIYSVLTITAALVVATAVLILHRIRRRQHHQRALALAVSEPEFRDYFLFPPGTSLETTRTTHCPIVADEWELPLSGVKFGPILGSGAFGKVVKGRVTKALLTHRGVSSLFEKRGAYSQDDSKLHVTVAIKMLQDDADSRYKQDFLKEMQLMKKVGHHENVVSMLGCCTLRDPVCLIVEHAEYGDLLSYLKDVRYKMISVSETSDYVNRDVDTPTYTDLLTFAWHVSRGMDFLASKGFVHRDLAARNVLVCAGKICKIGDFGLARYIYDDAIYVNRRGGRLPVKWMSVEAIFDLSFSTASDVWSFGILLYEIVTLGGTPYPTIPTRDLLAELRQGYRMGKPDNCSPGTYDMMRQCWQTEPKDRPSFSSLSQWLEDMTTTISASELPDIRLNLSQDLYNTEDDNDIVIQTRMAPATSAPESSNYTSDLVDDDDDDDDEERNSALCHTSLSGDSGYASPQKESVSSGESTLTIPADAAHGFNHSSKDYPTGVNSDEPGSWQCPGVLYENVFDDVFQEEDRNPAGETEWRKAENIPSPKRGHVGLKPEMTRSDSWSPRPMPKRRVNTTPRRQSLPELSCTHFVWVHCKNIDKIRRRSDSMLLDTPTKPSVKYQLKVRAISYKQSHKVSKRRNKYALNKQRRKAVVIPPSLALDNSTYYVTTKMPRQQPPVLHIPRKKRGTKGKQDLSPGIWARDGEFNFRRSKATNNSAENDFMISPTTATTTSQCPEHVQKVELARQSSPLLKIDVHVEFDDHFYTNVNSSSTQLQSLSCMKILEAPREESMQQEDNRVIGRLARSSRKGRMFVRSSCNMISSDVANLKSETAGSRKISHRNHSLLDHQYADFNNIISQSGAWINQEVTGGQVEAPGRLSPTDRKVWLSGSDHQHGLSEESHWNMNCGETRDDVPNCCEKNTSRSVPILETLSQALRRTYSSPKEHTLTQETAWNGAAVRESDESVVSLRRLSDPSCTPTHRMLKWNLTSRCFTARTSRSQFETSQHSKTTSPGKRFPWSPSWRRKECCGKADWDSTCRKQFPQEKHPAALHMVTSHDVCLQRKCSLDLTLC